MLNAAIGMLVFVWANDLIVMFIGLELMSLCLYVLIAMSAEDKLSKESAFKYFVLGSFASAIMLYGISFIYGTAGSTYLPELKTAGATLISTNRLFLMGFVMLLVGVLFKIAAFPVPSLDAGCLSRFANSSDWLYGNRSEGGNLSFLFAIDGDANFGGRARLATR